MKLARATRLDRNVHRAGDIIGVLVKYGLADCVKGLDVPWVQDRIRSADGPSQAASRAGGPMCQG